MLSSELLGYPAGARVLIINCDDLGMHESINVAVLRAMQDGVASSCSLMVPCPAAHHAMQLLRRAPDVPFGIHLTLTRDTADHRWAPVTSAHQVPSLLDGDGRLFTTAEIPRLLAQARLEEVERELRAQIRAVDRYGLAPTHLDWHCIADGGRPDLLALTIALAAEHGLAARVWLDPGRDAARRRGLPVVDHDFLDSFALGVPGKTERYVEFLRALPAGLSEWAVHPGLDDDSSHDLDAGWPVRQSDFEFLTSAVARRVLAEESIHVIDYSGLQRIWKASAERRGL
ncbi:ChbG/HpnK family deacetylase [Blastococcus goldschmidtiae]|uniref:ChbG/HpnK family deacetylase n=1 Tax=Blastococcus goldschmidtiae TaxID=3075546 RepID=A0ABU2KBL6_9ACTN|nr:ChbG/HpnK family deacetylase [Blastococcus sp. DSM 46792]MDT0277589.1 ChbG/HpnK family deacetylase [Blastococcus sp. DSM 46792]